MLLLSLGVLGKWTLARMCRDGWFELSLTAKHPMAPSALGLAFGERTPDVAAHGWGTSWRGGC